MRLFTTLSDTITRHDPRSSDGRNEGDCRAGEDGDRRTGPEAMGSMTKPPAPGLSLPGPRAFVNERLDLSAGFPNPAREPLPYRNDDLGLPKTLGRLGSGSVIGFPNPRDPFRPAAMTM